MVTYYVEKITIYFANINAFLLSFLLPVSIDKEW